MRKAATGTAVAKAAPSKKPVVDYSERQQILLDEITKIKETFVGVSQEMSIQIKNSVSA